MEFRLGANAEKVASFAAIAALGGLCLSLMLRNRQLHREVTHDELTGLLNTKGLQEFLRRSQTPQAILYIDITNLKAVNDLLGHNRGDQAIQGVAQVLRSGLRTNDAVARGHGPGGDEFIAVLNPQPRSADHNPRDATEVLVTVSTRIQDQMEAFLTEQEDLAAVGFHLSVGGAIWTPGADIEDVRHAAEAAMYRHKDEQHQLVGQYR